MYLCLLLHHYEQYGHYLVFKGRFHQIGLYTNRTTILKDWSPKKFEYNKVKGYYVNQVYGKPLEQSFNSFSEFRGKENYFTSRVNGPDIIRLNHKLVDSIFDTYKVYNIIYCLDDLTRRTKVNKNSEGLVAVPIKETQIGDTGYKVATFVYVSFELLMNTSSSMTRDSFLSHVLKNKKSQTF